MDGQFILQCITTVGFPIVMCLAMAYYVKYVTDKHRDEVAQLNEQHKEEMLALKEAINNNTNVMTRLCERLAMEDK